MHSIYLYTDINERLKIFAYIYIYIYIYAALGMLIRRFTDQAMRPTESNPWVNFTVHNHFTIEIPGTVQNQFA